MRKNVLSSRTLWLTPFLMAALTANASLTHEWSFGDAPGSTTVTDSVGNATGTLVGNCTLGGGQIVLDGAGSYIHLPGGILPNLTNATFEFWTTWNSAPATSGQVTRFFDFGTNNGTSGVYWINASPDGQNATLNYPRFVINNGTAGNPANASTSFPTGQKVCVTGVFNDSGQLESLYLNGAASGPIASAATTEHIYSLVNDVDDNIGKSQFAADGTYNGSFDEFRIYNNAFTPDQVEADYESGPNVTTASSGTLTAIQLNDPTNLVFNQVFAPSLLGTYSGLTNKINITSYSGIAYSSDNTNIIAIESNGNFMALGSGSTTIRATYQSLAAALTVTVGLQPPVLLHEYSFNGSATSANGATIVDSVGGANGTFENPGNSSTVGLNGSGQLVLDGNTSSAWVYLPGGILPQLTNATFEIWVNQQNDQTWEELWTFGTNNGTAGQDYLSMIPVDGGESGNIGLDNHMGAIPGGPMPLNQEICLTAVYNYSLLNSSIYINGRKTGSGTMGNNALYTIPDTENYIGQSQFYGGGDPYWAGLVDEFRIYSGVVSDFQLAVDTAAGPNTIISATNVGAISSVTISAPSTTVDAHALGEPLQVLANFAHLANVDVTTVSGTTFTVSNPKVGTVVKGNFVPLDAGVCTVTGTFSNDSSSLVITVADTNAWPTLLHRWSFSEPPGSTTLTDLVGTVNGTVNGPAVFDGQKMTTPSVANQAASNSGANGAPAASAAWVAFPGGQGLVTGLPNEASMEIWVEWNGSQEWAEIFDFGQATTPGVSSGGYEYVMVTAQDNNGVMRSEWDQNPSGYDVQVGAPAPLPTNTLCQIVYSHDQDRQVDKLYLNGQLVNSAANTALWSSLPDSDNWLARDEWPDPVFSGQYWDFRMWNGALTGGQVANLYAAGPAAVAGPPVQISATGSAQVTISWPANAKTFTLESATNLLGTWTPVSGSPSVVNGFNTLAVPRSQSQTFYKLTP